MRLMGMLLLCSFVMTAALADKVYRWVDDQGHAHYSQSPPPGIATKPQAVDVKVAPADPAAVQHAQDLQNQMQAAATQQAAVAADQQSKANAQDKAQRRFRCDSIKAQLAAYEKQAESGQGSTDANGRKTYANVANRNQAMQQLQKDMANTC